MDKQKTVFLSIRVDEELHHKFIIICKKLDRTASQITRDFMREFVEKHKKDLKI